MHPSIVGIKQIATWNYPKQKLQSERIVQHGSVPWTLVRITQFYDYCWDNSRILARFPVVAPVPAGFAVQPVDPGDVARHPVDRALGDPSGRVADLAGP